MLSWLFLSLCRSTSVINPSSCWLNKLNRCITTSYIQQSECQPHWVFLIHFFGSLMSRLLFLRFISWRRGFLFRTHRHGLYGRWLDVEAERAPPMKRTTGTPEPSLPSLFLAFWLQWLGVCFIRYPKMWITFQSQPLHKCFLLLILRLDFLCLRGLGIISLLIPK